MRRKHPELRFEEQSPTFEVGEEVPLSLRYCLGPRPRLIAIDGDYNFQPAHGWKECRCVILWMIVGIGSGEGFAGFGKF